MPSRSEPVQLTIDGREEPIPGPLAAREAPGKGAVAAQPLFVWHEARVPGTIALELDPQ